MVVEGQQGYVQAIKMMGNSWKGLIRGNLVLLGLAVLFERRKVVDEDDEDCEEEEQPSTVQF